MEPIVLYFVRLALIIMIAALLFRFTLTQSTSLFLATAIGLISMVILLFVTPRPRM